MTVEDAITKLKKYPPHYEIIALLERDHKDDLIGDFVDISNDPRDKLVCFELKRKLS